MDGYLDDIEKSLLRINEDDQMNDNFDENFKKCTNKVKPFEKDLTDEIYNFHKACIDLETKDA